MYFTMAFFSENLSCLPHITHSFDHAGDSLKPRDIFYCIQKHGANIIQTGLHQKSDCIAADAIFTRSTRPIGIVTADCLPILLGSSKDEFVAVIHGGWRGLTTGVISNSFRAFRQAGIPLQNIQLSIGPAIEPCCYEVSSELINHIEHVHGKLWRGRTSPWTKTRKELNVLRAPAGVNGVWLDLKLYCTYLLESEGLYPEQIQHIEKCTYCSGEVLGSYRRRTHRAETKSFQHSWISLNHD
ncbi:polyphenol oxidase family protein [Pseudomonas sp. TNT2022 ID681]|uniref:Polyphenol oxidase family protein n=2 Tax=Pseudomonas fontis TaxID=2942633 RepID=A0ABT5NT82_9PSED|nr:polyphenol oxidase family protein [Pseudomonas fontis]